MGASESKPHPRVARAHTLLGTSDAQLALASFGEMRVPVIHEHTFVEFAASRRLSAEAARLFHRAMRAFSAPNGAPLDTPAGASTTVTAPQFLVFLASILADGPLQQAEAVACLCSGAVVSPAASLRREDLLRAIAAVSCGVVGGDEAQAMSLAGALIAHRVGDELIVSQRVLEDLLADELLPRVFFEVSARALVKGDAAAQGMSHLLPTLQGGDVSTLLNTAALVVLNSTIHERLRQEWQCVFSSARHGASFSQLYHRCVKARRPIVLVIRTDNQHVFGGFAAVPLAPNGTFFGTMQCFVFSLVPTLRLYFSSGLNDNFLYMNAGQSTLPNGIGFGGQLDYFGLFVDSELMGHSKAEPLNSTYNSPQLSPESTFRALEIEAWAVGPVASSDDDDTGGAGSILDKDKEAQAILELAGRTQHSKYMREPPKDDDDGDGDDSNNKAAQ